LISAGDGTGEHPTQALLDLYTIKYLKYLLILCKILACLVFFMSYILLLEVNLEKLMGLQLPLLVCISIWIVAPSPLKYISAGDLKHGRTVHSLASLLTNFNVKLNYVSPESLRMPKAVSEAVKAKGISQRFRFFFLREPQQFVISDNRCSEVSDLGSVLSETDILYVTRYFLLVSLGVKCVLVGVHT